jgi:hypothetical protein
MVVKVVRAVLVELAELVESVEMEGLVLPLLVTRMEGTQTEGMEGTQTVGMLTVMTADCTRSREATLPPRHYHITPRLACGIPWKEVKTR